MLLRASAVSARGRDPLQVEERKSQQGRGWRGRGWTPGETEFWEEARERERGSWRGEGTAVALGGGDCFSRSLPSRVASRRGVLPSHFLERAFFCPTRKSREAGAGSRPGRGGSAETDGNTESFRILGGGDEGENKTRHRRISRKLAAPLPPDWPARIPSYHLFSISYIAFYRFRGVKKARNQN